MAIAGLNLPLDIPWERICVTTDMLDDGSGVGAKMPAIWQTSLALYRYVPAEEYQVYPGRRIVYYKLGCTITNFQPHDDQLVGLIDAGLFSYGYMQSEEVKRRLSASLPCTGAVVQVSVTPADGGDPQTFPYFLDVQPRQRLLYEQATDAQERVSRSLETLGVRKSAGNTNSLEVLDVDKGGAVDVKVGDVGVGGSRTGEWGSQSLAKQDSDLITTTDGSRESRETLAFTTQLSQMYTLLQAYHVGTNRVAFLITPRPHAIDPPTGVAGPRKLDGIQELFLVVSQDADDELPCITARLDTGHLAVIPQLDYDRSQPPQMAPLAIDAPAPVKGDGAAVAVQEGSDTLFGCIKKTVPGAVTVTAPAGYIVEGAQTVGPVVEIGNENFPARSDVDISADRREVVVSGNATGYACYRDTFGEVVNVFTVGPLRHVGLEPVGDTKTIEPGMVRRNVLVSFRSAVPVNQVGEEYGLTLTFRQIKCCEKVTVEPPKLVAVVPVPGEIVDRTMSSSPSQPGGGEAVLTAVPPDEVTADIPIPSSGPVERRMVAAGTRGAPVTTRREAVNDFQRWMGEEIMRLSAQITDPVSAPAQDRPFMLERLVAGAVTDPGRTAVLTQPAQGAGLDDDEVAAIAEAAGRKGEALSRADLLAIPDDVITDATGHSGEALLRIQLRAAGIPLRKPAARRPAKAAAPASKRTGRTPRSAAKKGRGAR
jgi:hypothetical protein